MIKTYRGLLADGGQDRIRLQTIKGKVGYRIVKFQLLPQSIAAGGGEHTAIITKTASDVASATVDFTDSDLLAAAFVNNNTSAHTNPIVLISIFDNEIFNQDIYVSQHDHDGTRGLNYYLELEVIPLDDAGAEYTTLKDMRQV